MGKVTETFIKLQTGEIQKTVVEVLLPTEVDDVVLDFENQITVATQERDNMNNNIAALQLKKQKHIDVLTQSAVITP